MSSDEDRHHHHHHHEHHHHEHHHHHDHARPAPKDADEAWERLKAGNESFAKGCHGGKHHQAEKSVEARSALKDGQKPFVTILCCSDSRVPPEVIFGEGLGAVFIVRVAGNVVDDALLGTIEYGLHHLHTPLLLILGHSSCGAVKAALSMKDLPDSPLGALLKLVKPAADAAVAECGGADATNTAIKMNVLHSKELALKSPTVKELVESGHVKVKTAVYDLDTGLVSEVHCPRPAPKNGDEAWARLKEGNERFAKGQAEQYQQEERSVSVRAGLTGGQKPFVTILCCSDSRVPPEVIFGEGLGAVFIVRVAGNVVDDALLGTIEYGLHHLHTPLLLILGHSSCGAVKAALSMKDLPDSPLGALLKLVKPAADAAVAASGGADATNAAIKMNVLRSKELVMASHTVKELVHEGHVKVITAVYDLDTGLVSEVN